MKRTTLILISLALFMCGCSRSQQSDKNASATPTTAPNVQPYCIFYNNQLYQYNSEFSFTEGEYTDITVLGAVTNQVEAYELPSNNFETNMDCFVPAPLFGFKEDFSKIIMEVYQEFSLTLSHKYYLFTLQDNIK
ncbi:MAG: hypothetical protein PUC65_12980 [Clostridiales bacterium]|nr:hypothetical protein [Clostridiales bacterium]